MYISIDEYIFFNVNNDSICSTAEPVDSNSHGNFFIPLKNSERIERWLYWQLHGGKRHYPNISWKELWKSNPIYMKANAKVFAKNHIKHPIFYIKREIEVARLLGDSYSNGYSIWKTLAKLK